ncbi:cytochrome c oxidase subunit 7B [Megachile rotundata]|uniref:cytochrome c oxidase subunit 7B n=1 Tax=Megachile rotundata TaxID=143995 RepID=UPI000614E23F|nr:PREDICTED: uncharacterized protein LOC105663466 [Megachile rotundata]
MFRQLLRPIIQTTRTGARASHDIPHDVRPPHLDEVPVPCGSWKEAYDKANQRYNLQLAVSVVTLIATIAVGRYNGMLWLNFTPPTPKPKEE